MGDYAGFVVRVNKDIKVSAIEEDLIKYGARNTYSNEDLNLILGIMKASYPGGCKVELITIVRDRGDIVSLAEKGPGADDYCSLDL